MFSGIKGDISLSVSTKDWIRSFLIKGMAMGRHFMLELIRDCNKADLHSECDIWSAMFKI